MTFSSGYVPIVACVCAVACFCPSQCVSHHCVFTVTADEKPLQTKTEGSDVSLATDQLTEDKHGTRLDSSLSTPAEILSTHLTDKGYCCQDHTD